MGARFAASPFARRRSPDRAEASAAINTWVHKRFALKERSSVTVSEIVCRDPERTGGLEGGVSNRGQGKCRRNL
jgi:hypothetical protein